MQAQRRWVPPPAAKAVQTATRTNARTPPRTAPGPATDQDLAFCAEFEAGGGTASSETGFADEGDLLRMERSGLLNLYRSEEPPYAVTWVEMTAVARLMLSRGRRAAGMDGAEARIEPPPGAQAGAEDGREAAAQRHGFETARGMIAAAVKAELSGSGRTAGPADTARLLERISRMTAPF